MSNQYFGKFISQGKTFNYDAKKHNRKYTKAESLKILDEINDIITKNLEYLRQQRLEDGFINGYMDYSIISMPFFSSFVSEYMNKKMNESKVSFSQLFDNALTEFLKQPERNVLWGLASIDKHEYYIKQIIGLKNRIRKQIDRLLLSLLIPNYDQDLIIVVNHFEKEYLYDLPNNVVGFVCKHYDNYDLILELSYAYEIPIVSTSRNVSLSSEILIDSINNRLYIDPKEYIVKKALDLKSLYVFNPNEKPRYKSDVIKFYANIVDKRGIDKAKISSWYAGVALFRTEYLYITKGYLPSKEEQIKLYVYLLESFKDRFVQIRIPDFGQIKALDYEFEVFTEIEYIADFHRIFQDNILAIHEASRIVNKQVTIIIPMLRVGKDIDFWKNQIEAYVGFDFPNEIKPKFGIMMENESNFIFYEDYRNVDSVVFGLNDFLEDAMEISRFDEVDFESFMLQAWHDLQLTHQHFRRNGIRLLHIVSGNALRQTEIFRKFIKKGFKHFAIPLSYIKVVEEVLVEHESTRGAYVGVHAKREKAKIAK